MSVTAASKLSFTVRRPTPVSRNSSEAESDSSPFKIPALPRHLNGARSATGSPLSRSANSSPKHKTRTFHQRDSSDEEDEEIQDELVTGFDQFGVERLYEKKPQGPLVIAPLQNRDWREVARKRKAASIYVPSSAQVVTGVDGSVGGLGTRDSINSGPRAAGLQIRQKRIKVEDEMEVEMQEPVDLKVEQQTEDEKALRAILASVKGEGNEDGPTIEAIRPVSEDDAYRQDVAELPEEATLDDYERVPVSQFGAAMLRGMGWKEGQAASRSKKGPVQPWLPQSRPHLLGIGAKEKEVLDDGGDKRRKGGKKAEMKYVPVLKREKSGTEGSSRRDSRQRSPSAGGEPRRNRERSRSDGADEGSSRGHSRNRKSPSYDGRRRDDSRRDRDRDYPDGARDGRDKRDYDDDRYRDGRRDNRRDYDRSHRERDGDRRRDKGRPQH